MSIHSQSFVLSAVLISLGANLFAGDFPFHMEQEIVLPYPNSPDGDLPGGTYWKCSMVRNGRTRSDHSISMAGPEKGGIPKLGGKHPSWSAKRQLLHLLMIVSNHGTGFLARCASSIGLFSGPS